MTRFARRLFGAAILSGLALLPAHVAPAQQGNAAIRVEKVKYAELGKLVRAHTGKVVVVDFWATDCLPCRQNFPHVVQMQNQYKDAGLVAISVAVDDTADAKRQANIVKFLEQQKASQLTNVNLDEKPEFWAQKLGVNGVPCVYVFNREGRIAGKWPAQPDGAVDYDEVDKTVADLMKK